MVRRYGWFLCVLQRARPLARPCAGGCGCILPIRTPFAAKCGFAFSERETTRGGECVGAFCFREDWLGELRTAVSGGGEPVRTGVVPPSASSTGEPVRTPWGRSGDGDGGDDDGDGGDSPPNSNAVLRTGVWLDADEWLHQPRRLSVPRLERLWGQVRHPVQVAHLAGDSRSSPSLPLGEVCGLPLTFELLK